MTFSDLSSIKDVRYETRIFGGQAKHNQVYVTSQLTTKCPFGGEYDWLKVSEKHPEEV